MIRSGLTVGLGIGGGSITADNCPACGGGLALEGHIGGMVTPQLALMADLFGIFHSYDDGLGGTNTLSNSMFTVAAQYWVMDKFWLKGGLGDAHIELSDYAGNTYGSGENALAILAAAGSRSSSRATSRSTCRCASRTASTAEAAPRTLPS
jgi:hypothetical protein